MWHVEEELFKDGFAFAAKHFPRTYSCFVAFSAINRFPLDRKMLPVSMTGRS